MWTRFFQLLLPGAALVFLLQPTSSGSQWVGTSRFLVAKGSPSPVEFTVGVVMPEAFSSLEPAVRDELLERSVMAEPRRGDCSVRAKQAERSCSTYGLLGRTCTARCDSGDICSVIGSISDPPAGPGAFCSTTHVVRKPSRIDCSVFDVDSAGPPGSTCSTVGTGKMRCSANGGGRIFASCSALGAGDRKNFCSATGASADNQCSSFASLSGCSIYPPLAGTNKRCSSNGRKVQCSVVPKAGTCTSKSAKICSGFGAWPGHCSVIGGKAGQVCSEN